MLEHRRHTAEEFKSEKYEGTTTILWMFTLVIWAIFLQSFSHCKKVSNKQLFNRKVITAKTDEQRFIFKFGAELYLVEIKVCLLTLSSVLWSNGKMEPVSKCSLGAGSIWCTASLHFWAFVQAGGDMLSVAPPARMSEWQVYKDRPFFFWTMVGRHNLARWKSHSV